MDWALTLNGTELAKVLNFTPATERTKILTRLYNGRYMAQTVGEVSQTPTVTILVETMDQLRAVNQAEAECAYLDLRYRGTNYRGYIKAAPKWTAVVRGSVYTGSISFVVDDTA